MGTWRRWRRWISLGEADVAVHRDSMRDDLGMEFASGELAAGK